MADDNRLGRAAAAFVRQQFSAPVAAIVGFADILREDARRRGLDDLLVDIEHIGTAAEQLRGVLSELLDPHSAPVADAAAAHNAIRHELRTPLSAIKGYGEMLIEEAAEAGHRDFADDIAKLLAAADDLLGRIDALIDFGMQPADGAFENGEPAAPSDLVVRAIASIQAMATTAPQLQPATSRILVVDDAAFTAELLSRRLMRDGHQVVTVYDGRAALDLMRRERFEIVLLDLMMPEMSGFEVLCRMKADAELRDLPVIVLSALDEFDTIVRCIEAGAEDYLPRPFNPVLLQARISACLEKKRLRDREHAIAEQLRREKEHSEALLLNILPQTIMTRLRRGEADIADHFAEVTILFCDIVDFTSLAGIIAPAELIDMLNRLFTGFDRLAVERGLEKIKTIGDAYMVAGGLPEPRADHAQAVADLAIHMLDVVRDTGTALGRPLSVRIGINSGPVIAGIIGRNKFIYDVWGDTVNTASRMEAHGAPGCVHISGATAQLVGEAFVCEPRGIIDIRGKGPMETFFLGQPRA